jgi:hypothetical protein
LIVPASGGDVQGGASWGFRGPAIRLIVGSEATEDDLRDDWVAVHEMTHLAQPDIREPHLWLAEGTATYVEPIARVQAGQLSAETIWGDMVRDMPKGLPEPGDRGLDRTPTWGRSEWGWPIARILSVGDKATGTTVLTDLYAKMGTKPYAPDLDALWRDLGVSVKDGRLRRRGSARADPPRHYRAAGLKCPGEKPALDGVFGGFDRAHFQCLARRLRLEDGRLFGEGVDALALFGGRLLDDGEFGKAGEHEHAGPFQFLVGDAGERLHDRLHVFLRHRAVVGDFLNELRFRHHARVPPLPGRQAPNSRYGLPAISAIATLPLPDRRQRLNSPENRRFGAICQQIPREFCSGYADSSGKTRDSGR